MKQPHTKQSIAHTENQQNTGHHKKLGTPDEHRTDRFGGISGVIPTALAPPSGRGGRATGNRKSHEASVSLRL